MRYNELRKLNKGSLWFPRTKMKPVAKMLKAIHSQESKKSAREKGKAVIEELRKMKLKEAADKLEKGIEETLTYMSFSYEHWLKIRTTNLVERINREIKRRTRVVGIFPDGNSALMLVCARLRHVTKTQWGIKRYMNMKHLENYSTEDPNKKTWLANSWLPSGKNQFCVIFSSVYDSSQRGRSFFFDSGFNMLNVAVSRAKDSFLVFGAADIFDAGSNKPSGILARYIGKA